MDQIQQRRLRISLTLVGKTIIEDMEVKASIVLS